MRNRIHITGGDDLSLAGALYRGDKVALAALLASLGGVTHYRPIGHQPPSNDVHVGADVMTQPDGSSANVEPLPIAPIAGTSIAAGVTTAFELKPTRPFQPTALVIDDDIAKNLVISNLTIGGNPVGCGSGGLIGRGFSNASFTNVFSSYWADNNAPIAFDVTNIHASAAQVVRGHFLGNSVRKAV